MRVQVPNHHVVWKEDMTARGGFFVKIVLEDLLVPREGNHTTCGQLEDIQRSMPYLSDVGRQMEERKSNACIITEMEHQAREQLPTTETKSGLRDQPPAFHAERTGDEKQHLGRQLEQRHGWHFCFRFVRIYFKGVHDDGHDATHVIAQVAANGSAGRTPSDGQAMGVKRLRCIDQVSRAACEVTI